MSIIPLTQSAVGVPHIIDDVHADRVIDHNLNCCWIWFLMRLSYRRRVNLGLAYFCMYSRGKYRKCWYRENHDVRRSKLIKDEEPVSSVRYHSSCLQSELRSYLYSAWHSVVLKTNEVWIFVSLQQRSDYLSIAVKYFRLDPTISLIWLISYLCSIIWYRGKWIWDWLTSVCTFEENKENVGLGKIMMSSGLDYSRTRNQNLDPLIKLENEDERICVSKDMKALENVITARFVRTTLWGQS